MLFLFLADGSFFDSPFNHCAVMAGKDDGDNKSESSFVCIGSDVSVKAEDHNMEVDKSGALADAQSDSKEVFSAQGAVEAHSGITDGVGVPASPEVAIPPGDWSQPSAHLPAWFIAAFQVTVIECMENNGATNNGCYLSSWEKGSRRTIILVW